MAKRATGMSSNKPHRKKSLKRLAAKKKMLLIKAMKPAARKKALLGA